MADVSRTCRPTLTRGAGVKKKIFIAWIRYHRRSELLAQHLGTKLYFVQYGQPGKIFQAPLRYVIQSIKTLKILKHEKPHTLFVQNPPIFLALIASWYSRRHGAQYVIDSHTGAFQGSRWGWSVGLHRLISKRALTTIVHNKSQEKIVANWGCHYNVIAYTPGDYPSGERFPFKERFNVAMACSFVDKDEPIQEVLEAARRLPDVGVYLTGNNKLVPRDILQKKPDNCRFVGFLPNNQYIGLLRSVDAIMVLTKWNHTLVMGGFEAVCLGKPLITSDWPVLKEYFSMGTIHTPNTIEGIYKSICQTRSEQVSLQHDILRLRDRLDSEWKKNLADLQKLLNKENSPG